MESTSSPKKGLLSTVGGKIQERFISLVEKVANSSDAPISRDRLIDESQRFSLWAINLGLYHTGHSSLDYRFRDAPTVSDFAHKLLKDLENNLSISMIEIFDCCVLMQETLLFTYIPLSISPYVCAIDHICEYLS